MVLQDNVEVFAGGDPQLPDCPELASPTWAEDHLSGSCDTVQDVVANEAEQSTWGFGTVFCLLLSLAFCSIGVRVVKQGATDDIGQAAGSAAAVQAGRSMDEYAANIRAERQMHRQSATPTETPPQTVANPVAVSDMDVRTSYAEAKIDVVTV